MAAPAATPENPINIRQPLLLLPPLIAAGSNTSLKTLFWCTISTAATFTSLTSLSTMSSFKYLTEPYTQPILILLSLIISTLHFLFFFNLHRIPTLDEIQLLLVEGLVDGSSWLIYVLLMFYPQENSVEVAVFNIGLAVDVLAVVKLVNCRRDCNLFYKLISVAMCRVVRAFRESDSLWFVLGSVFVLHLYYVVTEGVLKVIRNRNVNRN